MASFITTMLVPLHSSPPPQPLNPHCTLKQSASCVTINSYVSLENGDANSGGGTSSSPASSPSHAALRLQDLNNVDSSILCSNARSRNQFKPARANKGTTSYQLRQFAEATLGSGSLRKAVKLPEGEDLNEWLAVNGILSPSIGLSRKLIRYQWSTSTTRSIFSTVPSLSSAPLSPALR